MPSYTFECQECGHQFIRFYAMNELQPGKVLSCPSCRSNTATRIFTAPQVLPDSYRNPVHLVSVKDANDRMGYPIVEGRGEHDRALEASNKQYDTQLERV